MTPPLRLSPDGPGTELHVHKSEMWINRTWTLTSVSTNAKLLLVCETISLNIHTKQSKNAVLC